MFIFDVLKNLRNRADQREVIDLVSGMTDGQMEDLGLGGLREARQQAIQRRVADAAGWGPWPLG